MMETALNIDPVGTIITLIVISAVYLAISYFIAKYL